MQAVQHAMFAQEWLDDWPDEDRRSRLVFIVHQIPRAEILAHFAFAGPRILGDPRRHDAFLGIQTRSPPTDRKTSPGHT